MSNHSQYLDFLRSFPERNELRTLMQMADVKENEFFYMFDLIQLKVVFCKNMSKFFDINERTATMEDIHSLYHPDDVKQVLNTWAKLALEFAKMRRYPSHDFGIRVCHRYIDKEGNTLYADRFSSVMYDMNKFPRFQYSKVRVMNLDNDPDFCPELELIMPDSTPKELIDEANLLLGLKSKVFKHHELDLLYYVSKGMTYDEIAQEKHLSTYTIQGRAKKMIKKHDVKRITQLVDRAHRNGLLNNYSPMP